MEIETIQEILAMRDFGYKFSYISAYTETHIDKIRNICKKHDVKPTRKQIRSAKNFRDIKLAVYIDELNIGYVDFME